MRKLIVYNFLTLNGFYKGTNGDISWHNHGTEQNQYSEEMLAADNILLFGRVTYEMMASFWTSQEAIKNMPAVANGMNKSDKIVLSRTLHTADWNNTKLIKENSIEEVKKLKQISVKDIAVLGSGSIVTQLAENNLVDEFQIMIDPIAINDGTPLLKNIKYPLELNLIKHKIFKNGVVLLCYEPKK